MRPSFEKLDVYKTLEKLADSVWSIVRGWDTRARYNRQTNSSFCCDKASAQI